MKSVSEGLPLADVEGKLEVAYKWFYSHKSAYSDTRDCCKSVVISKWCAFDDVMYVTKYMWELLGF